MCFHFRCFLSKFIFVFCVVFSNIFLIACNFEWGFSFKKRKKKPQAVRSNTALLILVSTISEMYATPSAPSTKWRSATNLSWMRRGEQSFLCGSLVKQMRAARRSREQSREPDDTAQRAGPWRAGGTQPRNFVSNFCWQLLIRFGCYPGRFVQVVASGATRRKAASHAAADMPNGAPACPLDTCTSKRVLFSRRYKLPRLLSYRL